MNEKKMVSRSLAIALGIICILLIAVVAYFSMIDISAQNSYNNLQNQNKQLEANNTNLQNQVNNLTDSISDLNSTVMDLNTVVSLGKNTQWNLAPEEVAEDPNSYEEWSISGPLVEQWDLNYAGYVWIHVDSNNTSTYVELIWGNYGVNYDNQIVVGINGTAVFPVLPVSVIGMKIRVGNTDTSNGVLVSVTATYYY